MERFIACSCAAWELNPVEIAPPPDESPLATGRNLGRGRGIAAETRETMTSAIKNTGAGVPLPRVCPECREYTTSCRCQLLVACEGALAALSQNATFPADIEAAKRFLRAAIAKASGEAS